MRQGKRGMTLENMIEHTNNIYRKKGWGLIDKVPTPWVVNYNKKTGKVYRAFPQKKGTVDFTGISHGKSIAFDAKSTQERTRFPLNNIEPHQKDYLLQHQDQGGISFMIIHFEKLLETYFFEIDDLNAWWVAMENGGRKSIPYSWFITNCKQVKSKNGVALDYLTYCETV